jgi:hypothetical protein
MVPRWLLFCCMLSQLTVVVNGVSTKEISPAETCAVVDYFDITRNNCTSCNGNGTDPAYRGLVADRSALDVYGNALSCVCGNRFREVQKSDGCSAVSYYYYYYYYYCYYCYYYYAALAESFVCILLHILCLCAVTPPHHTYNHTIF